MLYSERIPQNPGKGNLCWCFQCSKQKVKIILRDMWKLPGLDFTFESKCHLYIWHFHPLHRFHFTTRLTKSRWERAGWSLFHFSRFMFPADVHPQRVGSWCVESTVWAGESLCDLVLGFNVPPHVREFCSVVFTVVFTVVQTVLPTLVVAWKILIQMKNPHSN